MEIVTARLLLRDFTEAERPGFLAYQADPRYLACSGRDEADPDDAQRLFQRFRDWASEQPRRNYQLAILRRQEPQALVGCCGLRGAGCEAGTAELGIELAPAYWGRHGYAIEVGRALLEFGFGDLGLQEIYGVSVNANARIARLAEWFGAEAVAPRSEAAWMSARGWNETAWRITRDRWQRWVAVELRGTTRRHRCPEDHGGVSRLPRMTGREVIAALKKALDERTHQKKGKGSRNDRLHHQAGPDL